MQEYERTVKADTFEIVSVLDEIELVSLHGKMFASRIHASDTPAIFTYTTAMMLASKRQPDVLRLSCMHWESVSDDNYLSIKQMRQALGDNFVLQLKQ